MVISPQLITSSLQTYTNAEVIGHTQAIIIYFLDKYKLGEARQKVRHFAGQDSAGSGS